MRILVHTVSIFCFLISAQMVSLGQESGNQEAEQIEIARDFVEQMFVDPGENSLARFQMSEKMKDYFSMDTFRKWAKAITDDYGKPDKPDKIEVVRHENGLQDICLFCHCNRYPIKISITFDGAIISGFHWKSWKEEFEKQRKEEVQRETAVLLFYIVGLPILCFLIIFIGERRRNRSVKQRQEYYDPSEFEPAAEETYVESQNPVWYYFLLLAIWVSGLVPLAFVPVFFKSPAFVATEIFIVSIIISIIFLPLFFLLGIFFYVDRQYITIRLGFLRIPIKRIPLNSILSVDTMKFRPLMDFGGWGIRRNKNNVTGYFMSGNQGVLVTMNNEKKYLLGSDIPERLLQVIQTRCPDQKATRQDIV